MQRPVILVAEDEHIIGADLCDTVAEAGYHVEGPHGDLPSAMLACQLARPDLAILDVQLGDDVVYPLAEQLMAQGVPVIFHSGVFSQHEIEQRFPAAPTLSKPCPPGRMLESVAKALTPA
jgi:CheY-like chemotaxis protein